MTAPERSPAARRVRAGVAFVLVLLFAGFLAAALVRRQWAVAVVFLVFLVIAVVMLRQRLRTGEPISLLATAVRLFQRR